MTGQNTFCERRRGEDDFGQRVRQPTFAGAYGDADTSGHGFSRVRVDEMTDALSAPIAFGETGGRRGKRAVVQFNLRQVRRETIGVKPKTAAETADDKLPPTEL